MRHELPAGQMSLSLVQIAIKAYTRLSASRVHSCIQLDIETTVADDSRRRADDSRRPGLGTRTVRLDADRR